MKRAVSRVVVGVLLLAAPGASTGFGQEPSGDELRREIQALQESLKTIQKDLQEIKGMLARQAPVPSGIGAVIDYGTSPVKGEQTAKLTLVEFSDYQ